ncbi:MAG: hypothetical protein CVU56_07635 [Deltaproteobacteria bacterium HGW-Deltaproteobacteria-14]|nr:MAG: hypothetical protein CVU56_07635 [Deltaproteobacteria bacterium HGW-Deltaproteobacteria-14]
MTTDAAMEAVRWALPADVPRKKRDITRAAARLFYRHGMRRVSVEEICASAKASKGTFYKYFPNKIEVLKYILVEMSEASHRRVAAIEAMDLSFAEKARLLLDERLDATRKTSSAFIEDFYHAGEELAEFIEELTATNQRRFLEVVTAAQRRGDMRPEVKPEFVLALLGKLNELAGDDALRAHYAGGYVELMHEVVDFFFYGLLSSAKPAADGGGAGGGGDDREGGEAQ